MLVRASLAIPLAVLALLAAGCGGDDTTSATAWAGDLCSAVTTWTDSLAAIKPGGLSRDALQGAVDDAKGATQTFVDDLQDLGRPDTESGADAQAAIDDLAGDLAADLDDLQRVLRTSSTRLGAIASVTNTLTTMGNQVRATVTHLEGLDAKGELRTAFDEADSCKSLRG
jgi:hypothetical protein